MLPSIMTTDAYRLSLWLLMPCFDAPESLFIAGLLVESAPMPEAEAHAAFAAATYASEMELIAHENEPVLLSLERMNTPTDGQSIATRNLFAAASPL